MTDEEFDALMKRTEEFWRKYHEGDRAMKNIYCVGVKYFNGNKISRAFNSYSEANTFYQNKKREYNVQRVRLYNLVVSDYTLTQEATYSDEIPF